MSCGWGGTPQIQVRFDDSRHTAALVYAAVLSVDSLQDTSGPFPCHQEYTEYILGIGRMCS